MVQEKRRIQETKAKIVSGTVGSFLTAFAVHPLEVVKVRTQAQRTPTTLQCNCSIVINNGLGDCLLPKTKLHRIKPSCKNPELHIPRNVVKTRGTFGTLRHILLKEGVGSLYAGLGPTLTMGVPSTIIYFLTYDELSRTIAPRVNSAWAPAVAGAAARFIASLSTAPLELVRTIQASKPDSRGMLWEFQNIVRQEGVVGLYRGLAPSLMRDVPFSSIYWMSIESCRAKWLDYDANQHRIGAPSTMEHAGRALVNGTLSGLIAAACTTPLDVIKTNQQLQVKSTIEPVLVSEGGGSMTAKRANNSTTMEIAKRILAEEGLTGFWRGNAARMTKVAPACACMIASYEVGQKLYLSD